MDLAALAEKTDLPKSTLVRLLLTMKLHNVVFEDEDAVFANSVCIAIVSNDVASLDHGLHLLTLPC